MRKLLLVGAVALPILWGFPMSTWAEDPSDMAAYFEEIRESRMTERARGSISGVTGLRLGYSLLEYHKDEASGMYWPAYTSTTCPLPGADPEETAKWRAELARVQEADIIALRPFADTDGSGFVTSTEGRAFRFLVEYGYLAVQLAEGGAVSLETLATASGKSLQDAEAELADYLQLAKQIQAAGLEPLPTVELKAAAH